VILNETAGKVIALIGLALIFAALAAVLFSKGKK
jgi:hypothetical protein